MGYRPNGSEAESRIRSAANEARQAADRAENRRLKLEKAVEIAEGMHVLGADESTIAAFVDKMLAEVEDGTHEPNNRGPQMRYVPSDRCQEAMQVGYLYSEIEGDEAAAEWSVIANDLGFPTVLLTRRPQGVIVTCMLDESRLDTPINKLRATRAIKKAQGKGRPAGVIENTPDNIVAGIFPEPVAVELAKRLARLTGRKFPLSGDKIQHLN